MNTRYKYVGAPGLVCPEKGRTRSDAKDDCDINKIIARAEKYKTGIPNPTKQPIFADTTAIPGYQDALDIVLTADRAFGALPAKLRRRFNDDPMELISFLQKAENRAEAEKLGLINPRPAAPPPEPVPVPDRPAPAEEGGDK